MPNKGTYTVLDIASVRDSSQKTIQFLKNKLPKLTVHTVNVIFLGEEHNNDVDMDTATGILANPPVLDVGQTRVVLEGGLPDRYQVIAQGMDLRIEPRNANPGGQGQGPVARSKTIADMIQDALENHGKTLVYVACGSAHAPEVFKALNKTYPDNFGFVVKPSCTD